MPKQEVQKRVRNQAEQCMSFLSQARYNYTERGKDEGEYGGWGGVSLIPSLRQSTTYSVISRTDM